ncbi:MAG: carbohydrate porin [Phycisphaerales bacterium]
MCKQARPSVGPAVLFEAVRSRPLAVALLMLAAGSPTALAQAGEPVESEPVLTAEAYEMFEFLGGPDLPGQEPGERERRDPDDAASEKAAVPTASEAREWFGGKAWWEWSRATGDWGGARTALEDHGLTLSGSFIFDLVGAWSGGRDQRSISARLFDFNAMLDLDKAFGIKGGSVFADFQVLSGNSPSRRVGDFQGTSNLESDQSRNQLSELWYQQWLFDDVLRIKLGKIDGNKEFDFLSHAVEFLNTGAGLTVTSAFLPCYPDPSTAVCAFIYPTQKWYIGLGFFDGAIKDGVRTGERGPATFFSDDLSDDFFYTAETGVTFDLGFIKDLRIAGGVWHQEGDFEEFNGGGEQDGTTGFYVISEGTLWSPGGGTAEGAEDDDNRGLVGLFRYGHADEEVVAAGNSLGGGLHLIGTFPGRDSDTAGVWVNWVDLSDEEGAGFENDETVVELFYKISVTPWITVTPDIQFVTDPSGSEDVSDAVVGSLRVSITF